MKLFLCVGLMGGLSSGCADLTTDLDLGRSTDRYPVAWGPSDNPNILASDLNYVFAQLPTSGEAENVPWAGNYWPTYRDSINYPWAGTSTDSPTKKFATAFGRADLEDYVSRDYGIDSRTGATVCTDNAACDSAKGETCSKRLGETEGRCIETWFGICHAWSPAAILEREPKHAVTHNGVEFKVNDIKALVSLSFTAGVDVRFMSLRCNKKNGGEGDNAIDYDDHGIPVSDDKECADTNAGSFHVVISNLLGLQKRAFVEDRTFDYEVWNQPVRSYDVTYNRDVTAAKANELIGASGNSYQFNPSAVAFRHIRTTFRYITESGQSTDGHLGGSIDSYTRSDYYEYVLELDAQGKIIGGEWVGASKRNHPDFIWLPVKKNDTEIAKKSYYASGTGIKWSEVKALLDKSLADPNDGGGDTGGFDWGTSCEGGDGEFQQDIAHQAVVTVGEIPPSKRNVRITLESGNDVDIQLIDKATGFEIIAWPNGALNGDGEDCTTYQGVQYCYSGYNGTNGQLGHEWIEVRGDTNRQLVMKAYGYAAGNAQVAYSWDALSGCSDSGSGSFEQQINHNAVVDVGVIPTGKKNIKIELRSDNDVDVQLYDGQTALVQWPDGRLNGASRQVLNYGGMVITWSGYNGDGSNLGHEYITIKGTVSANLTMKAFGYAAGQATVDYAWGLDDSAL